MRRILPGHEVHRIARAPPVVGLALALAAGAAPIHLGVPAPWTLLSLLLLLRPKPSSHSPGVLPAVLAFLTGAFLTGQWAAAQRLDCRLHLGEKSALELHGRVQGRVVGERGELLAEGGMPGGCRVRIRFVLTRRAAAAFAGGARRPGAALVLGGEWRKGRWAPGDAPIRAGYLRVDALETDTGERTRHPGFPDFRSRLQARLGELFPSQGAIVEALVLARKEGLSPEIREAFARAGTAHLLAISGFHVGVVVGLLLLLGGWMGLSHPARFLLGSVGVWVYVLIIGLPDAALRAAFILSLLAAGRIVGRPVAPLGALAGAFLLFIVADPGCLLRIGFQLSFAGAVGLMVGSGPAGGLLGRVPVLGRHRVVTSGLAAGISATLATLPLVAWHFGRVSLVGIPVTLLATPLVTLAIPGIFLSLLASLVHPVLGRFLAMGVEADLWMLTRTVSRAAELPFASAWVSRPAVMAACAGVLLAAFARRLAPPGTRGRILLPVGALSGALLWPAADLVLNRGILEMVVLDVGQGDALALRSPKGQWMLVDAGPQTESYDAGERVILPYLRQRGAGGLALLALTHPDMDHVGGSGAILRQYPVGAVLDPGRIVGSQVFMDALRGARAGGVPWRVVQAGDSVALDGVALRVLWPPGEAEDGERSSGGPPETPGLRALAGEGNNEASVVLELRFGDFAALLTGDAPTEVEEAILPELLSRRIQILKVGHHGSATSTSSALLERISPETAVISVGRRNRYGHPSPSVLRKLDEAGVAIFRTDRDGPLVIRARRDGSYQVHRLTPG